MEIKTSLNLFKDNRTLIIRYWIENEDVLSLLKLKKISLKLFIKKYATGVFDYYIDVALGYKQIGECPIINELLEYFKDKKITTKELFLICSGFKNAMIKYAYEINCTSYEFMNMLNSLYEKNFSGVLDNYSKSIYKLENELNRSLGMIDKYIILSRTNKEGNIIYVSQALCDISGYTKDELLGRNHNFLKDPSFTNLTYNDLWKKVEVSKTSQNEIRNINKNKEKYWLDITIESTFNENHEILTFDTISHDITTKKQLEEKQKFLIEQSKAAVMGEMISLIAHQWKQPLQTLSILIQKLPLSKLSEGFIKEELIDEVVVDSHKQIDYMSNTIDDFRDFFKPNKIRNKLTCKYLVEKTLEFLSYMIHINNIDLSLNVKDDLTINIHENEMIQVLINIIKNAKDVLVKRDVVNKKIIITMYKENNHAIFEISDNAGGINKNDIKRVFEPYFSTKSNKNGTGLGLYMAKTIVEDHCFGTLSVSNNLEGALFKIKLPLV